MAGARCWGGCGAVSRAGRLSRWVAVAERSSAGRLAGGREGSSSVQLRAGRDADEGRGRPGARRRRCGGNTPSAHFCRSVILGPEAPEAPARRPPPGPRAPPPSRLNRGWDRGACAAGCCPGQGPDDGACLHCPGPAGLAPAPRRGRSLQEHHTSPASTPPLYELDRISTVRSRLRTRAAPPQCRPRADPPGLTARPPRAARRRRESPPSASPRTPP